MNDFEIMLGIFVMILGSTIATAVLGLLTHMFLQSARRERRNQRALDTYERIVLEKMDVIKTAVAVGFDSGQLDELDTRLEKLIGAERLQELMEGKVPSAVPLQTQLIDADLIDQVEHLSGLRKAGQLK